MADNHKQKREGVVSPNESSARPPTGGCGHSGNGSHPDPRKGAEESEF